MMVSNNPNIDSEGFVNESIVRDMFRNPLNFWDSDYIEMTAREVLVRRNQVEKLQAEVERLQSEKRVLANYIEALEDGRDRLREGINKAINLIENDTLDQESMVDLVGHVLNKALESESE